MHEHLHGRDVFVQETFFFLKWKKKNIFFFLFVPYSAVTQGLPPAAPPLVEISRGAGEELLFEY